MKIKIKFPRQEDKKKKNETEKKLNQETGCKRKHQNIIIGMTINI